MKRILIINGPNLNMLGKREPEIYGHATLEDIEIECKNIAKKGYVYLDFRQSNYEGEIVSWVQETLDLADGIIINAAAYTHTSIAIHDALKLHKCPIIEVHLSDPKERESFRHISYIEPLAKEIYAGYGAESYYKALKSIITII